MATTMSPPRWLITGASGFLGANVSATLGAQATQIAAIRPGTPTPASFDSAISLELEETVSLAHAVRASEARVVFHAAALSSHESCEANPALAERINVDASRELARAAASIGGRFILISTDAVFDGERGHYAESDLPNPTSVYGRTKAAAERAVLEEDPSALIIRTNFFGWSPTGKRSILEFFVNSLSTGTPVRGFTDFVVTSLYAQSLAETIIQLVNKEHSGIVHVAASDTLSKYDFGIAVAREFGLDEALITPTMSDMQPPRGRNQSLDASLVEALLNARMPTQAEGIRRARHEARLRMAMLDSHAS